MLDADDIERQDALGGWLGFAVSLLTALGILAAGTSVVIVVCSGATPSRNLFLGAFFTALTALAAAGILVSLRMFVELLVRLRRCEKACRPKVARTAPVPPGVGG